MTLLLFFFLLLSVEDMCREGIATSTLFLGVCSGGH